MKCCKECFNDQEIIGFFISNASVNGNCDFCKSNNVAVIDPRELEEKFLRLVQQYQPTTKHNSKEPILLHEFLQKEWGIFNSDLSSNTQNDLLKAILIDKYSEKNSIFNKAVELKEDISETGETDKLTQNWEQFTEEIKFNNRYFLGEKIDVKLLEDLLKLYVTPYRKNISLYRARISSSEGFGCEEMGKPPKEKANAGRANPVGIPYLYVCTDFETVKYECRAHHFDFITVAEFEVKENLKVIRLRKIEEVSPFIYEDRIEDYLKYRKYLKRLEIELSTPLRRYDHELEYLPTQYLCEYVKYLGYDAIEYGSSLYDGGINLAIFNDGKLEIKKIEVHEVVSVDLETRVIDSK